MARLRRWQSSEGDAAHEPRDAQEAEAAEAVPQSAIIFTL
jgi:hypothetical protein